ncbi:MAG: aminoglycoside 6-adenylyltransferase [Chloroflexota bacterium]
MNNQSKSAYQETREELLVTIADVLGRDKRIQAAWLTGSYGRDQNDAVSDVDITLVIGEQFVPDLCVRSEMVTASPDAARMVFFSQFGQPIVVHENNYNAPGGGTFTAVLYHPATVMVDWTLCPRSEAIRPSDTRLLFDHVGIPAALPSGPTTQTSDNKDIAQAIAFFWMMACVTAKYIVRGEAVLAVCQLEELAKLSEDVGR